MRNEIPTLHCALGQALVLGATSAFRPRPTLGKLPVAQHKGIALVVVVAALRALKSALKAEPSSGAGGAILVLAHLLPMLCSDMAATLWTPLGHSCARMPFDLPFNEDSLGLRSAYEYAYPRQTFSYPCRA